VPDIDSAALFDDWSDTFDADVGGGGEGFPFAGYDAVLSATAEAALAVAPRRVLDLGCGLNPLTLPWMGLAADATYLASDVDRRPLATVVAFLELVGQPHTVEARDLVETHPAQDADVGLLLKLVTTLDRQDPDASTRLLGALRVRHAVVSFPKHSLGGRGKGMERTYRDRLDRLAADAGRVSAVAEASVPNELVFVLTLTDG